MVSFQDVLIETSLASLSVLSARNQIFDSPEKISPVGNPGHLKVSPKDSLNDGWSPLKGEYFKQQTKRFPYSINLPQCVINLMQILPPKKRELPSKLLHSLFSNPRFFSTKSIDFSPNKVTSLTVSTFAEIILRWTLMKNSRRIKTCSLRCKKEELAKTMAYLAILLVTFLGW